MKKSKAISLVLLLFLVLALTLIPSGNVSALGAGDFFLTDEELPSSCEIDTYIYKTWPGPCMGIRMKLMGGYWAGKVYSCIDGGMVTVCVGYYPTEEEAKKWMNPDVYIYHIDVYAAIGHQGTTLSEWAQQSTEFDERIVSGTAYGDDCFTVQDIILKSYGDDKGAVIQRNTDNIFRIRNVIFHVVATEGVLDPLVAKKARRLLGEEKPVKMDLTVSTDNKTYSPGETIIVSGSVRDAKSGEPISGANVVIDINPKVSTTTDSSGNYKKEVPLPPDISQGKHTVTVKASKSGYPDKSKTTSFTVGQEALIVEISPDKENYLIGETVYCTITVKDSDGKPVPYANLNIIATRLGSGRATELPGSTDGLGGNLWSFTWGKKESGEAIIEGKLKIEVTASKEGYADGHKSIILSGCGDLECAEVEDCFDCCEDCKCGPKEVCDPSSDYRDKETMCSPKVAYIFMSKGLGGYHRWWISDDVKGIRKRYSSSPLSYKVVPTIEVDHINDVAKYLSRPSTKAIAYFGHGEEPGGVPTIEAADTTGPDSIKVAILDRTKEYGGFQYRCQYESYAVKWVDSKEKIEKIAKEKAEHPSLDYAYIGACYSLDDMSLRNYLLHGNGIYWGSKGVWHGICSLTESKKP